MPRAAKAKSTPKSAKDRKPSLRVQQATRFLAKKPQSNVDPVANLQAAKARLNGMFNELVPAELVTGKSITTDDITRIDLDASMAYLQRIDANLEDIDAFVVLSTVQSDSLGDITREGFVNGWAQHVDLDVADFTVATITWAWQTRVVRARINKALTDAAYFRELYNLGFEIAREPPQKAISMENALGFWGALYNPTTNPWRSAHVDWLAAWTAYFREKFGTMTDGGEWEYSRTVSKDLWNQTRLFALKTMEDETLGFWSEEQAWPGLIDEFVVWCKEKGKVGGQNGEAMEVEA